MSLKMRLVFFGLIGVLAGALAWPVAELLLLAQTRFPSLLVFSTALGLTIGVLMGGAFGAAEGIITASAAKVKSGVLAGVIIGGIGGMVGFVVGQGALLLIGTGFFNSASSFRSVGLPVSKAVGWAAFGVFLGSVEGARSRSWLAVRNGIIGGLIGGFLGGLVFEFIRSADPGNTFSRLVGLIVLGLAIGLFYALVELQFSGASMYLLNGKNRGKEFPISKGITTIGSSEAADICIPGYAKVMPFQAEVHRKPKGKYLLVNSEDSGPAVTLINDKAPTSKEVPLENESVVRVGTAQFRFHKK